MNEKSPQKERPRLRVVLFLTRACLRTCVRTIEPVVERQKLILQGSLAQEEERELARAEPKMDFRGMQFWGER